jgi:hypothetical protein
MNKGSLGKNWEIINIGSVVHCACFLGSINSMSLGMFYGKYLGK